MIKFIKKIIEDNKETMKTGDWIVLILVVTLGVVNLVGVLITRDPYWILK
jgi:hypothetical protein